MPRNPSIDIIRGCAIIIMIAVHSCAVYLNDKTAHVLWSMGQFIPFTFVFLSSQLFFQKYLDEPVTVRLIWHRVSRLLFPYYCFLIVYLGLVFIKDPDKITWSFLGELLIIKVDQNFIWLILLFLQLAILNPLIAHIYKIKQSFFTTYAIVIFSICTLFIFWVPGVNFRLVMWAPWSILSCIALLLVNKKITYQQVVIGAILILALGLGWRFYSVRGISLLDHKHPPDLLYLSGGFLLHLALLRSVFFMQTIPVVAAFISYFGKNSYTIYFIHQLFLYMLTNPLQTWMTSWIMLFIAIMVLSIALISTMMFLRKKIYLFNHE